MFYSYEFGVSVSLNQARFVSLVDQSARLPCQFKLRSGSSCALSPWAWFSSLFWVLLEPTSFCFGEFPLQVKTIFAFLVREALNPSNELVLLEACHGCPMGLSCFGWGGTFFMFSVFAFGRMSFFCLTLQHQVDFASV